MIIPRPLPLSAYCSPHSSLLLSSLLSPLLSPLLSSLRSSLLSSPLSSLLSPLRPVLSSLLCRANIDSYSAFFDNCKAHDTGLAALLEAHGVTDVYCCGLVYDICVKSSALHGAEMGFNVTVIEDACRSRVELAVLVRPYLATTGA